MNNTDIQIIVEKSKQREFYDKGELLHYIDIDFAYYGFKPITHPQIKKIHQWARKANISINEFDELDEILLTNDEIIMPEEDICLI